MSRPHEPGMQRAGEPRPGRVRSRPSSRSRADRPHEPDRAVRLRNGRPTGSERAASPFRGFVPPLRPIPRALTALEAGPLPHVLPEVLLSRGQANGVEVLDLDVHPFVVEGLSRAIIPCSAPEDPQEEAQGDSLTISRRMPSRCRAAIQSGPGPSGTSATCRACGPSGR